MGSLPHLALETGLSVSGPSPAIAVPQQRIASLWGTTFATRATGSATTIIRAAIGNAKHEGFNDGAKPTANAVAAWLGHAGQRSRRAVWALVVEKARLLDALCSSAPPCGFSALARRISRRPNFMRASGFQQRSCVGWWGSSDPRGQQNLDADVSAVQLPGGAAAQVQADDEQSG